MDLPLSAARLDELTSWHADWAGLRVVVLGLGVTGFSVADTLVELGASVLVVASGASAQRRELLDMIGARFAGETPDGPSPELLAHQPHLVVVSPGYRPDHPILRWAIGAGVPVWGDIELAWRLRDKVTAAPWVTITGTNGKTTTTQLVAHLLRESGRRVGAVGNIGVPVLDAIRDPAGFDLLVVELSSFQLHWIPTSGPGALHPLASACLNIADDHLDWHGGADAYAAAKGAVYANTEVACVYNRADPATRRLVEQADVVDGCIAVGFGLDSPGPGDLGFVEDLAIDRAFVADRHRTAEELTTLAELQAAGLGSPHMAENVLAAAALVRAAGTPAAAIRSGLGSFRVDHHRTEPVGFADEVLWIDDSKATNPHAANASLSAFDRVVWIVGGLLKGVDLAPLVERHADRVVAAIVIGEDRQPVVESFARHAPAVPVFEVDTAETEAVMPEAVRLAAAAAQRGDVVLLAPAAASMDQFIDYGDRGRRFAAAVKAALGGDDDHDIPAVRPASPPA